MPAISPGMNKTKPNEKPIEGRGQDTAARPSPDKDQKILERAKSRIDLSISRESTNRKAMVDDLKFLNGDQWPADILAQRNTDRRPAITVNRMPTFVHQITNSARENRPSIYVSPVGERSDKDAAKMYRGLIRQIERKSRADIAYDTALFNAVANGLGWLRLVTEWESEDSFDQCICIKRVRNPFTVYLDPDAQEPDGSDAKWGFVTEVIPESIFKEEYPDAQVVPFDLGGIGEKYKSWTTKDGVRIAEYYEVVREPRTLVKLSTGWKGWKDEMGDILGRRIADGSVEILDERDSFDRKVKCYKLTALEILERYDWLGKWIPLIPVIGEEIDIEGRVVLSGIIRNAKDPQRMLNYWRTLETELIALAPKAPWLIAEGQDEGYEQMWATAHTKARAALKYKPTDVNGQPVPPPTRPPPVGIPEGVVKAADNAAQDMMATTGIRFDSTLAERTYDESGRALRELSRKGDVGAFHFIDNESRSMKHLGDQIVDLIPKVLTDRQVVTILREDDTEEQITIDPMMSGAYREQKTDKGVKRFLNPGVGDYGVTVDIGPSYATKRIEASESMMEFVKAMPQTAQLVMDLIASEMDWPGAEKIAARLAKAVPPQVLTADLKDIPPQIQALIQNLEQQSKALQGQLQQAMRALQDKQADRDVALEKIQADFEAKLLAIIAKTEDTGKKLAVEQAKFVADTVMEEIRTQRAQAHERTMAEHAAQQTDQRPNAAPTDKEPHAA